MSLPESGILVDWESVRKSDTDLALEGEFVGSSSPITQHRSGVAPDIIDDGSAGYGGTEADFFDLTDEKLRERINRLRCIGMMSCLAALPDGGEKMRIYFNRMEKELERREVVWRRKQDTVRDEQATLTGGSSEDPPNPYTFTSDDWISDNMSEKYHISPCPTPNMKTHVQATGGAFSKVQRPFSQHKHAHPNKNGQMEKISMSHQLTNIELHPKSIAKSFNVYNESTNGTRKRPLQSCNRWKSNIVDSVCSQNKLAEDATFVGDSDKWRDWAKLPSDLTDQIATLLLRHDVTEYIRLRAACEAWRQCTADPRGSLESRFRPRQWIMLSNCDGERRRFLNLVTGACVQVDLPELSGHCVEASTEGLLVLRDKVSDCIRLLHPFTRCLIELPPITAELRRVSPLWHESGGRTCPPCIGYAGISDETSPPSVALFLKGDFSNIVYAKPGDKSWALVDDKGWRILPDDRRLLGDRERRVLKGVWYMSVITLRGRIYFATYQGHILKLRLHPRPRLLLVVTDQHSAGVLHDDVVSYLVPADDIGHNMLMVRYYDMLLHLTPDVRRRIKRTKKTNLIKLPSDRRGWCNWHLLEVFRVDLRRKQLVPAGSSIGQRAVFVGDVAAVSLSSQRFPSVYGDAVYIGVNSLCSIPVGLRRLKDNSIEPRLELVLEGGGKAPFGFPGILDGMERIVPHARPCSLEEYLVCYVGFKDGIKD